MIILTPKLFENPTYALYVSLPFLVLVLAIVLLTKHIRNDKPLVVPVVLTIFLEFFLMVPLIGFVKKADFNSLTTMFVNYILLSGLTNIVIGFAVFVRLTRQKFSVKVVFLIFISIIGLLALTALYSYVICYGLSEFAFK